MLLRASVHHCNGNAVYLSGQDGRHKRVLVDLDRAFGTLRRTRTSARGCSDGFETPMYVLRADQSSSSDISIASSSSIASSPSSLSSSLARFLPCVCAILSGNCCVDTVVAGADAVDAGALKMDFCVSVKVAGCAFASGVFAEPSKREMTSDFPLP